MSIDIFSSSTQFESVKDHVKEMYKADHRPWVIGYSGGKDSTTVVQIVFSALQEMGKEELTKKVYVISSDTLVETPLIISSISRSLARMQEKALELDIPLETHKVKPKLDKTFWSSIIGKGYPSPRQKFRWCTDRMKIDPANQFIKDKIDRFGEVIMLLGVRDKESSTRAAVMQSHTTEGKTLMRHSTLMNAYVYAPIRDFTTDDVWEYLLSETSPWGDDNSELLKLYQDSNSECPLVVDTEVKESAGSCGNSRFGCWTCTVVQEDKALSGFINNGEDWMRPLLDFRNWLAGIRDQSQYRKKFRMNGQIYLTRNLKGINEDTAERIHIDDLGNYLEEHHIDLGTAEDLNLLIEDHDGELKQLGLGPFNLQTRKRILKELLRTQQKVRESYDPNMLLISIDELKMIRQIWQEHGDWEDTLPKIVDEESDLQIDWEENDRPVFNDEQLTDLEHLASEYNVNFELIKKLLLIEQQHSGYNIKRGILKELDKTLKQEYLHL